MSAPFISSCHKLNFNLFEKNTPCSSWCFIKPQLEVDILNVFILAKRCRQMYPKVLTDKDLATDIICRIAINI